MTNLNVYCVHWNIQLLTKWIICSSPLLRDFDLLNWFIQYFMFRKITLCVRCQFVLIGWRLKWIKASGRSERPPQTLKFRVDMKAAQKHTGTLELSQSNRKMRTEIGIELPSFPLFCKHRAYERSFNHCVISLALDFHSFYIKLGHRKDIFACFEVALFARESLPLWHTLMSIRIQVDSKNEAIASNLLNDRWFQVTLALKWFTQHRSNGFNILILQENKTTRILFWIAITIRMRSI